MHDRFKNIINSEKPVLVDFYAEWCAPCRQMPPILKALKDRFKDNIRIIKVDVDRNQAIASKFQIQSIPSIILFKNGEVQWKGIGVQPVDVLDAKIQSFL